ncbi:peptidoglycan-binding protein [Embleya sp. NPDC005971]|uniref:peptidoglycan-binding protein n=1 Tax=Embleya sp. NPDC005971 TaxID=3156724 RepID=UPI0033FAE0B0
MSGPSYISGAERLGPDSGGSMDTPDLPPRAVWHTVESPAGSGWFSSMASYLKRESVWPQVLYDPASDRLGQFTALDTSGRALRNDGGSRTNRTGRVCIQVEVCGRASQPWTDGFDPASKPNFLRLIGAIRAWGIPDVWPAGAPQRYPGDHDDRDRATWLGRGGHYGHSQIPGNDHGDPGAIDITKVPPSGTATPGPGTPGQAAPARYQVTIGGLTYGYGAHGDHVTAVGRALVARGFGSHYRQGPGPDWSDADTENYADYQRSLGFSGSDADGVPGDGSLRKLLGTLPGTGTTTVFLAHLLEAERADIPAPDGHTTHKAEVLVVEKALAAEGLLDASRVDGSWGTKTRTAYAGWQRRLGFTGRDADGTPAIRSLTRLGAEHNFEVIA